jgi:hypothetical protein
MNGTRLQLLAWSVVLAAFVIFISGVVGTPWVGLRWLRAATRTETARVERKAGTIKLERDGVTVVLEQGGLQTATLTEGAIVTTQSDGRALVRLFDDGTVNLEPDTRLELGTMRRPRFGLGTTTPRVVLDVSAVTDAEGRLSVGRTWRNTDYSVRTPGAAVMLGEEARARIWLRPAQTRVHALEGPVDVAADQRSVRLATDRATVVLPGRGPSRPGPALENVLQNADFRQPASMGWYVSTDGEPPSGVAQATLKTGRRALDIQRTGSEGRPGNVSLKQDLKALELHDATFLGISVTLRIDSQSLGGGEQRTEYPLIVKLTVQPQSGVTDDFWTVGFYGVPSDEPLPPAEPTTYGILGIPVPFSRWVSFNSGNLLDSTSEGRLIVEAEAAGEAPRSLPVPGLRRFEPGPRELLMFELYASGHDYTSHADRVGLWIK